MLKMKTKVIVGKVRVQQENMRGWLVGQFFPSESLFNDSNVEIYLKTFPVSTDVDKLHTHPKGKEYMIVLK